MSSQIVKIVLVGLPNTGKTTLFNQLTGACHKVGNWCGVTVKEHIAKIKVGNKVYELIDLPGIMSVYDEVEQVDYQLCRAAIEEADILLNVIDGRYLQRDLVLSFQLLFYQKPQVALVTQGNGGEALLEAIPTYAEYIGTDILERLPNILSEAYVVDIDSVMEWPVGFSQCWQSYPQYTPIERLKYLRASDEKVGEEPSDVLIAEGFYHTAATAIDRCGCRQVTAKVRDLDQYLLHPYLGLPIFFLTMYMMFSITVGIGGAFGEFFSEVVMLGLSWVPKAHIFGVIVHAIGAGVATGIGFIPLLAVMYIVLGYLEQSGYLSRVSLLADALMRPIGLSGHAFIPMILGFGCNVPAVMATRVISGDRQRLLTALMLPFMSCSARLSIFSIFAVTFFPRWGALVIMFLYLLGIAVGVMSIWLLSRWFGFNQVTELSIPLPDYQLPKIKQVLVSVKLKLMSFIKRTMTYIILFAALFALLGHLNFYGQVVPVEYSMMTLSGQYLSSGFDFMGLDQSNWQAVAALVSGLVAKEVVITTLNSLYEMNTVVSPAEWGDFLQIFYVLIERLVYFPMQMIFWDLGEIQSHQLYHMYFTPLSAFAYMVFILLYFPCISTVVVLKNEFGARWAVVSFIWSTFLAVWFAKIAYRGVGAMELSLLLLAVVLFYIKRRNNDPVAS